MLIGIEGLAGSGKDVVASILLFHKIVSMRQAFADPIKHTTNALFGWDDRHSFGEFKEVDFAIRVAHLDKPAFIDKFYDYNIGQFGVSATDALDMLLSELNPDGFKYFSTSPRKVYQLFGTEVGRNQIATDIWTELAPKTDAVIPDVRFPNEAEWFQSIPNSTLIKVCRDAATPINLHSSESYIASLPCDYEIDNNGTLAELEDEIIAIFGTTRTDRLFSTSNSLNYTETDLEDV